jgi:hypothetical protein
MGCNSLSPSMPVYDLALCSIFMTFVNPFVDTGLKYGLHSLECSICKLNNKNTRYVS